MTAAKIILEDFDFVRNNEVLTLWPLFRAPQYETIRRISKNGVIHQALLPVLPNMMKLSRTSSNRSFNPFFPTTLMETATVLHEPAHSIDLVDRGMEVRLHKDNFGFPIRGMNLKALLTEERVIAIQCLLEDMVNVGSLNGIPPSSWKIFDSASTFLLAMANSSRVPDYFRSDLEGRILETMNRLKCSMPAMVKKTDEYMAKHWEPFPRRDYQGEKV